MKNHQKATRYAGLFFTIAVALFGVAMTFIVYADAKLYARIVDSLYDIGVDAIGAMVSAALYYGCLRQDGEGMRYFRGLNVLVSAGFLTNILYYCAAFEPKLNTYTFITAMVLKLIDLVMIYCFFEYVKVSLGFTGKLADLASKIIPILMAVEAVVILSNIIRPVTYFIDATGTYQSTAASPAEDVYLLVASLLVTILIIRSETPRNQKVAALTFVFLPVLLYAATLGEFGNGSQYGMVLMSLIIMYCVIFNYNSTKLAATQTELNMATEIQASMLPSIFPAFPEREDIDLYASMDPAKEVGGDFYDFFMIDDDHLGIVIADVSGKGVPAALFMMISKTVVQNYAKLGISAGEVLNKANDALCAQNKMEMFVTTWVGILELSTGKMNCANAGHEYPAIFHDGKFELYMDKHGLVLGAMEGAKYKEYDLQLEKGDKFFVYTDGVPEATNANEELYGTDRMIEALNSDTTADTKEVLRIVRASVDAFVGGAEQFDDLTMLCLEYKGQ